MGDVLTVTKFVRAVDDGLAEFDGIVVEGEVAEFKIIHGKWVTWQLKDETSTIGCFMTLWQYKTEIEDGMQIKAQGRPRLRDKGFFSFVVTNMEPSGEGALKRAFELLKKKLTGEGLFEDSRKRKLPTWPQHIALITSRDAAAFNDFLKVLQARLGGLAVSFVHTQVQGEAAPKMIINALERANTQLDDLDAIVLVRGGGSLEDLHAFNSEEVIRAVAASRAPIIVGVGHERDVTLAEMAADMRASTPSNAAEILVRSREEWTLEISQLRRQLINQTLDQLTHQKMLVKKMMDSLRGRIRGTQDMIYTGILKIVGAKQRFLQLVHNRSEQITTMSRLLKSLSPESVLKRGFSITRKSNSLLLLDSADVKQGDIVTTQLAKGTFEAKAK